MGSVFDSGARGRSAHRGMSSGVLVGTLDQRVSLECARPDAIGADVGPQRFGNLHAAVSLLIVFNNRNPCATDGQAAAVERMHKLTLLPARRTVANDGAACLKVGEVGAGRNLAVQFLPWQPDLNVVGL